MCACDGVLRPDEGADDDEEEEDADADDWSRGVDAALLREAERAGVADREDELFPVTLTLPADGVMDEAAVAAAASTMPSSASAAAEDDDEEDADKEEDADEPAPPPCSPNDMPTGANDISAGEPCMRMDGCMWCDPSPRWWPPESPEPPLPPCASISIIIPMPPMPIEPPPPPSRW